MKKQNVNNKLAFNKAAVAELNNDLLAEVKGGTTLFCLGVAVTLAHSTPAWSIIAYNIL